MSDDDWAGSLWGSLQEGRVRGLAVGRNQDGRLAVFGVATSDDSVWHIAQVAPNDDWSGSSWRSLQEGRVRDLAVGHNQDGRLVVFGAASDDSVWHIAQVVPNDDWSGSSWGSLQQGGVRDLAVGRNQDGRLAVFGVATSDDSVWHIAQVVPNDDWSGSSWRSLQQGGVRDLAVGRDQNGRLEVFGAASDDSVWQIGQIVPNDDWSGSLWGSLQEGRVRDLAVGQNQDGRLAVFGVATSDHSVWHIAQVPVERCLTIHFKSLLPITQTVQGFIDAQFIALRQLFARSGLGVHLGTTEDLSGNPNLAHLVALDVGACRGNPTQEQTDLFANRNNAGADDLVIYIAQTLQGGTGNFAGCATHPDGQPGAAIVQSTAIVQSQARDWLLAHEVGHVLDLDHVEDTPSTNSDFLMWHNVRWTNVPPDITSGEASTMRSSGLTDPC